MRYRGIVLSAIAAIAFASVEDVSTDTSHAQGFGFGWSASSGVPQPPPVSSLVVYPGCTVPPSGPTGTGVFYFDNVNGKAPANGGLGTSAAPYDQIQAVFGEPSRTTLASIGTAGFYIVNGGTGVTAGTYPVTETTGPGLPTPGIGTGGSVTVTVTGGVVTGAVVAGLGANYTGDDYLTIASGTGVLLTPYKLSGGAFGPYAGWSRPLAITAMYTHTSLNGTTFYSDINAVGQVNVITNGGGSATVNTNAILQDGSGHQFYAIGTTTISASSSHTLTVLALQYGTGSNITNGTTLTVVSGVTNPANISSITATVNFSNGTAPATFDPTHARLWPGDEIVIRGDGSTSYNNWALNNIGGQTTNYEVDASGNTNFVWITNDPNTAKPIFNQISGGGQGLIFQNINFLSNINTGRIPNKITTTFFGGFAYLIAPYNTQTVTIGTDVWTWTTSAPTGLQFGLNTAYATGTVNLAVSGTGSVVDGATITSAGHTYKYTAGVTTVGSPSGTGPISATTTGVVLEIPSRSITHASLSPGETGNAPIASITTDGSGNVTGATITSAGSQFLDGDVLTTEDSRFSNLSLTVTGIATTTSTSTIAANFRAATPGLASEVANGTATSLGSGFTNITSATIAASATSLLSSGPTGHNTNGVGLSTMLDLIANVMTGALNVYAQANPATSTGQQNTTFGTGTGWPQVFFNANTPGFFPTTSAAVGDLPVRTTTPLGGLNGTFQATTLFEPPGAVGGSASVKITSAALIGTSDVIFSGINASGANNNAFALNDYPSVGSMGIDPISGKIIPANVNGPWNIIDWNYNQGVGLSFIGSMTTAGTNQATGVSCVAMEHSYIHADGQAVEMAAVHDSLVYDVISQYNTGDVFDSYSSWNINWDRITGLNAVDSKTAIHPDFLQLGTINLGLQSNIETNVNVSNVYVSSQTDPNLYQRVATSVGPQGSSLGQDQDLTSSLSGVFQTNTHISTSSVVNMVYIGNNAHTISTGGDHITVNNVTLMWNGQYSQGTGSLIDVGNGNGGISTPYNSIIANTVSNGIELAPNTGTACSTGDVLYKNYIYAASHFTTTTTNAGSGGTPGTYTNVVLSGGTGWGMMFQLTVGAGGSVTSALLGWPGSGYTPGDVLTVPNTADVGGLTGFQLTLNAPVPSTGINGGWMCNGSSGSLVSQNTNPFTGGSLTACTLGAPLGSIGSTTLGSEVTPSGACIINDHIAGAGGDLFQTYSPTGYGITSAASLNPVPFGWPSAPNSPLYQTGVKCSGVSVPAGNPGCGIPANNIAIAPNQYTSPYNTPWPGGQPDIGAY